MDKQETTNGCNEISTPEKAGNIDNLSNKKAVWLLSLGHWTTDTYGGFIFPLMPFIAAKLGISKSVVAIIMTFQSLSSSLMQPLYGYISDKVSRRYFVMSGLIISTLLISSIGLVNSPWLLAIVLFLGGMGIGLFHPQATAMVATFSGKDINKAMGVFTACGTIGYASGPFIASRLGLDGIIYTSLFGLAVAGLMYKVLPKIPVKTKPANMRNALSNIGAIKKMLILLVVISVVKAVQILSFTIFMPFLWKELGYNVAKIGLLLSLFSLMGGTANYFSGKIADRIGRKATLVASIIPSIPCLLGTLYLVKSHPTLSALLFAISGFIIFLPTATIIVIAQKAAPENAGVTSGFLNGFSWGIVGLLITPLGFLADKFGITPVLTAVAFTPLLAAISTAMIPKEYE